MIARPNPLPGLEGARRLARRQRHDEVGLEHLILAWLHDRDPGLAELLRSSGVSSSLLARLLEARLARRETKRFGADVIGLDPDLVRTLGAAAELEDGPAPSSRTVLHQVLADGSLPLSRAMRQLGLDSRLSAPADQVVANTRATSSVAAMDRPSKAPSYLHDLTQEARAGRYEPIVGRTRELQALRTALCQKRVPNAVLLGPPGTGKTALVEEIARRVVAGESPGLGLECVLELDLSAFLGGAGQRGALEDRLRELLQVLESSERRTLLFVDEVHLLVGTGSAAGPDLANLLKPALARGRVRVVAATTDEEYASCIEKDRAFARRFQPIRVEEPAGEAVLAILASAAAALERHHGVRIEPATLEDLARWSIRHRPDRHNPDKALQMLDMACSSARLGSLDTGSKEKPDGESPVRVDSRAVAAALCEAVELPLGRLIGLDLPEREALVQDLAANAGLDEAQCKALLAAVDQAIQRADGREGPWLSVGCTGPAGTDIDRLPTVLARHLAGREARTTRVSLVPCVDRQGLDRLIGAAPGLVGYEEGGQLTEPVRRDPYQVVVLDGSGHTHPSALGFVTDVLTRGRVRDGRGRWIDFRQSVVVVRCTPGREEPDLLAASDFVLDAR